MVTHYFDRPLATMTPNRLFAYLDHLPDIIGGGDRAERVARLARRKRGGRYA